MHLEHPPTCPPSCNHCLAYDNITRALCVRDPSHDSKWCDVHEELQAKLLKSYKRLTLAYESFDDETLPSNLSAVLDEQEDLPKLRLWSQACRTKHSLAHRVIVARAEHHQQFYHGGDYGHTLFVETLKTETHRMERFLRALDRQAYTITLAQSQAPSWILDLPTGPSFVCNDPSPSSKPSSAAEAPPTPPPTPPLQSRKLPSASRKNTTRKPHRKTSSPSSSPPPFASPPVDVDAENDAFFASLSAPSSSASSTPLELLRSLRTYLEPPCDLSPSIKGSTWTAVISTLFRHVVLRVPSLATLALSDALPSVTALLDVLEARLGEDNAETLIAKLWKGLKFARLSPDETKGKGKEKAAEEDGMLGVGVIVEAIDAFFATGADGEGEGDDESVDLLGAKVWKTPRKGEWSREGWDLFYAFVACPGCSLIATRSLSAWTTNRRLAALGHLPAWLGNGETPAERIFRLTGVVLCTSNACQSGKKVKRVEQKEVGKAKTKGGKAKKTVHVEEWERSWMYVKLPLNDPASLIALEYLSSQPSRFTLLARKTASDELIFEPQAPESTCGSLTRRCNCCDDSLWLAKVRSGFTPIERKAARWTTTSFFPHSTVLSSLCGSSSPEARFHPTPFSDTYDAVILDASSSSSPTHDSWNAFAESVGDALLASQGCSSVGELVWREKQKAVQRGEMLEGEWEAMHACAAEQGGGKGRRGSKTRVIHICEDDLTARRMFREE